jgi:hypothetical protein
LNICLETALAVVFNVLTLRLSLARVNMPTQYVVDIRTAAQHIAPELQQARIETAMKRFGGNRRELWKY